MKLHNIMRLPEFHFVEWLESAYKIKKNTIQAIDDWLLEQGIASVKKRRRYVVEFIQMNVNHADVQLDDQELKQKFDDFWIEISFRKLLSI